jgi:hypothetical protein
MKNIVNILYSKKIFIAPLQIILARSLVRLALLPLIAFKNEYYTRSINGNKAKRIRLRVKIIYSGAINIFLPHNMSIIFFIKY